jgi:hypothetical protein
MPQRRAIIRSQDMTLVPGRVEHSAKIAMLALPHERRTLHFFQPSDRTQRKFLWAQEPQFRPSGECG